VSDGYFTLLTVPAPIATLIGSLPVRGGMASSFLTAARTGVGRTLANWAAANATAGVNLVRTHGLMGWSDEKPSSVFPSTPAVMFPGLDLIFS
jgi:hypothetical protein